MPRDTATSLPSYFGKNRRFFIGGAVYIWVISDFTTDFKLSNGKNRRFFIGGAVCIWIFSDSTSTFASPFSPDKALSGIKGRWIAAKRQDGRVINLSAEGSRAAPIDALSFDETGAKESSLPKEKRREHFAVCGRRQKALPFETASL